MTRTPGPSCHQTAKRADAGPMSPQGIPATPKVTLPQVTLPPSRHIEAAEKYTIRASLMVYAAVKRLRNGCLWRRARPPERSGDAFQMGRAAVLPGGGCGRGCGLRLHPP